MKQQTRSAFQFQYRALSLCLPLCLCLSVCLSPPHHARSLSLCLQFNKHGIFTCRYKERMCQTFFLWGASQLLFKGAASQSRSTGFITASLAIMQNCLAQRVIVDSFREKIHDNGVYRVLFDSCTVSLYSSLISLIVSVDVKQH